MIDYKKKYLKYKKKYLKIYGGEPAEKKSKLTEQSKSLEKPAKKKLKSPQLPAPPAQPAPQTALPPSAGPGYSTPSSLDLPDSLKKSLLRPRRPPPKCELKNTSKSLLDIILNFFSLNKNVDIGRKLTDFIARKGDICCLDELNIEKEKAIKVLYEKYQESFGEEYLNWLNNNIMLLIPKKICNYNANGKVNEEEDEEGIEIEKILDDRMLQNKKVDKEKLTALLNELPLYFILTIIGSEIVTREKNLYYL